MQTQHPPMNSLQSSERQKMNRTVPQKNNNFKFVDQTDRNHIQNKKHGPVLLNHKRPQKGKKIALIGWSLATIEAADQLGRSFIVVSLPEFESYANEHDIPFFSWEFKNIPHEEVYDHVEELYQKLNELGVGHSIPIFEETVEWAGALNAFFHDDPRLFDHSLLFRNKAMMKRRAHLGGHRVGVFEEGENKEDVQEFFRRVNHVLLRTRGEDPDPIHVKALDKAGATGHRMIRSLEDVEEKLTEDSFPCLMESHLEGIEISCEAFIHRGKVKFLNITEYVVFGYSMMVPPNKELEKYRPAVKEQVDKLVKTFNIEYGIIHPEFFISEDGELGFGELAYRIPGGHIFELMQKAYNFNPYQGHILCCDPNTTKEELKNFFPNESSHNGHAGSFLVYPRVEQISGLNIPKDMEEHPCFDRHTIYAPANSTVGEQEGYGNHYGTIFFYGDDAEQVKQPLMDYVEHDFYY